jgi:hypothetical protein
MKIELNKSDYNKVQAKLTKLKAINKSMLPIEINKGALNIARDMKRNAPVDTGKLRDLIYSQKTVNGAEIKSDANYSGYVEYGGGTAKRTGEIPFFYPAVNRGLIKMIDSIEKTIKRSLK